MANIMLIYVHIASEMINWALVHDAQSCVLSSPSSSRAALADSSPPHSTVQGVIHDATHFIAAIFSCGFNQTKSLSTNVRPTGELVIYLGLAPDGPSALGSSLHSPTSTRHACHPTG